MKIEPCKQICKECAFNGNTKDTLYAEAYKMLNTGTIFPCHMYLKAHTGSESYGVEKLKDIQVCRGYVAFVKKHKFYEQYQPAIRKLWDNFLLDKIDDSELDDILSLHELEQNHKGLRDYIYLGN